MFAKIIVGVALWFCIMMVSGFAIIFSDKDGYKRAWIVSCIGFAICLTELLFCTGCVYS